jgi:hypothetical protein
MKATTLKNVPETATPLAAGKQPPRLRPNIRKRVLHQVPSSKEDLMRMAVVIVDFTLAAYALVYRITEAQVWFFFILVMLFSLGGGKQYAMAKNFLNKLWAKI